MTDLRTFDPTVNPILSPVEDTDSYKYSHPFQVPPGTTKMVSYIEPRGFDPNRRILSPEILSALETLGPDTKKRIIDIATAGAPRWDHIVVYGYTLLLKRWLSVRVTVEKVEKMKAWCAAHGEPFEYDGWMRIATVHDGYMPVEISALPEGTIVPLKVPVVRVENLDPSLPWVSAFIETQLSRIWYPITVATQSMQIKRDIYWYLTQTCDNADAEIGFKLHDFGARGTSSQESAGIGGSAHSVNFLGTDTTAGIHYAQGYYNEPGMPAFSIPASEHSTITSWGGPDHEVEAFANMCEKFAGKGPLFAVVSDSYDIMHAVNELWGTQLKGVVEKLAEVGTTLVVRPDSGDPTIVPVEVIKALGNKFGYTKNSKGYKVLPKFVRCIQGDGVNQRSIRMILKNLEAEGWSTENIAFGMGGALLQQVDRDTIQFAMKTCSITRNGRVVDVYKQPKTDPGKNSKRGDQAVIRTGVIDFKAVRRDELGDPANDALVPVWRAGKVLVDPTYAEIRTRTEEGFKVLFARHGWKPENASLKKAA